MDILEDKLKDMNFVEWDRLIRDKNEISVYGWINRDDDNKDFVVLTFFIRDKTFWFITSSKKHSKTIHKHLYNSKTKFNQHIKCERVENLYKSVKNCKKYRN